MNYIGIDPGVSGGLVVIQSKKGFSAEVIFKTMPKSELCVWDWLSRYGKFDVDARSVENQSFAVIEWISPAMFGTAKSSMSKLYGHYRALRMALTAADIPFSSEKASRWQKAIGVTPRNKSESKSQWKQRLKARANELFPSLKITLATSDALLIAYYCRLIHGGGQ